ncbi:hypothetical protein [Azospirillum rugosum]|uniref:UDP-N-acetylmuramyl pentapeptide phosphotransferase/UDP-N-acetylglucosamine-1-phosphate transferase n=1 Tax=Azospirillum rugosum TaxID=416170 RepID=A0ABS4SML2_9PROT|nr:hypothetical protein [Azospirillum rugosum]MBP2293803.1 UDP-N-acetylmuramyl pentapeptide phosphotransferase/UDP-N-acetylglucosamine-1-phosphate transferase [Azospirillum rugosum]MDQ0527348.1 UDP-N-acetylmuramyl pentapeptide phosphotransferase/UDP-N-acetylglucosamine-1-phosphate transferase [Azospirillum rugosum]
MSDLLHDPFVQSSILPLLLSVVAVGALHRLAPGRLLAVAGIGVTFLAVFALVVGVPALPPPSSMGKLFWSVAGGFVLGVVADAVGVRGRAGSALAAAWLAASLVWIALPALDTPAAFATLLVLLLVGACVVFGRVDANDGRNAVASAAVLLALALAIGGTALIGSSASIAQMALALAAATGGFLLWNWPVERHGWGVSGRVASGTAVLLAGVLALYTQTEAAVLLLALPALLAERLGRRLPLPDSGLGRAAGGAAVTVLSVLPALIAIGVAYLLGGAEASPY